ncbi:MAG: hypothetical protein ACLTJG_13935 [[Clostridium] innocuum]
MADLIDRRVDELKEYQYTALKAEDKQFFCSCLGCVECDAQEALAAALSRLRQSWKTCSIV